MLHSRGNRGFFVALALGLALGNTDCGGSSGGDGQGQKAPSNLTYSTNPAIYTLGTVIAPNVPSSGGGTVVSYSVAPALPTGLSLDTSTGVISGTPTAITTTVSHTVTATNSAGSATVGLNITVNDVAPSNLAYSTNPATYLKGVAITVNTPSNSGGSVVSYSVSPALPAGLSLDTSSGVISGMPMAAVAAASYTVTARNSGGSATVSLNITVNDVAPSNLTYSTNDAIYLLGTAIAPNVPSSGGGTVVSYAVAPALPAGLSLDTSTGVISGTPTAVTATASYAVTATNSGGSTTARMNVTVTAQDSLTVDANASATLDGEQVFAGDVVIRNSSVVRVTSGSLILRARNVTVDATSQIVVAPTGADARGKGTDGGSASCPTICTAYGTVGGGGGGFGAAGSNAAATLGCWYYGSYYTCGVARAGGASYAIADTEVATGSPGGACSGTNGGNGGGSLAVYAQRILMQGQVTALGENASGCAGGGSGGSVVLRATADLTVVGSISVAGGNGGGNGAGGGGQGAIRLLYGDSNTIAGSTVGSVFSSFMPPYDVSSATHPDPTRWYNDDYQEFDLAWSKPFSTSAGYYRALNTTYGFVPGPSNALYQSGETTVFTPANVSAGGNYFHVAAVGPFAALGTVESRFQVNINPTPPFISSPSHPSETTWYANSSPYFTWSLPHPDDNTSSFYWVFDQFFETMPTSADDKIPMDLANPQNSKQLLLSNENPGIWFFHLVSQDTMGYLTKTGARFRVQIGTDPGKGSVLGTVADGTTSQLLTGVEISLNRGVLTTTTNMNGAFAFTNDVYAQQYEVRARKAGYQDAYQTVTVTAGGTATVNFALAP
jgi:hypothetical protein